MSTGSMPVDPERHRGERLDAAEAEDLVGAGREHRVAAAAGGCPRPARGGAQATTRATPAAFGTATVMNEEPISGYSPPGE